MMRSVADAVGIAGSTLCALHCLAVPVALLTGTIGLLPRVDDHLFHELMLWIVVPAAALAFVIGCRQHKDRRVMGLGGIGLVSLAASFTILHDLLGENGERVVAAIAAVLLIAAHLRNFRLCRSDDCDHDAHDAAR